MSPTDLSWLQTIVAAVVGPIIVAVILKVCVWCWRKRCINRDAEVVPSNVHRSDASHYSRAEEGRSVWPHGHTRRSDSYHQGPEESPQTEQEQDEDSRQGAVEPKRGMYPVEASSRPHTRPAKHIGHSGQGKNDIEPEGRLKDKQAPDWSWAPKLDKNKMANQDKKVLPLVTHDEHSEKLQRHRSEGLQLHHLFGLEREGLVPKKKRQS